MIKDNKRSGDSEEKPLVNRMQGIQSINDFQLIPVS
jgi:hypothetical protein